jgi:Inositol polyphosphate kinase
MYVFKRRVAHIHLSNECAIDWQEPDAPDEKRSREFQKYPLQSEFGFRIVGMRVYDPTANGEYRRYTKAYGLELEARDDLKEAFRKYFVAASGRCWSNFLTQLRPIQRWFEDNDCFAFYASSVLLVYEGAGDDMMMSPSS